MRTLLCYPPNFQRKCDVCAASFDISQGLSCSKGGLIIARHNKVHDKLLYLSFLQPLYTSNPSSTRAAANNSRGYTRGVIYWRQEVAYSFGSYGTDIPTPQLTSNFVIVTRIPTSMSQWEISWLNGIKWRRVIIVITTTKNENKSPFVIYVDGLLGREALAVLTNLSRLMAEKMDETILHVRGWINGRIVIVVASSYSRIICGARPPSPLWDQDPDWDPALGLGLSQ